MSTRPFLKWAGSKSRYINTILSALTPANQLIEPFTGSGAVFLNTNYDNYILGDQNKDLVGLFQCLKNEGQPFINYCRSFFCVENNLAERYYELRNIFNLCQDTRERAALFLYLNRHGYNGLCRFNHSGIYNVPFGKYERPYFPQDEMLLFYQKSNNAVFIHQDFRETFLLAQPGDVIYCDPPYVPISSSAKFASYTEKGFCEEDQIALAQLAMQATENNITVLISNHDTTFTRKHYADSEIISFQVMRYISCNIEDRSPVQELIAIFKPRHTV